MWNLQSDSFPSDILQVGMHERIIKLSLINIKKNYRTLDIRNHVFIFQPIRFDYKESLVL